MKLQRGTPVREWFRNHIPDEELIYRDGLSDQVFFMDKILNLFFDYIPREEGPDYFSEIARKNRENFGVEEDREHSLDPSIYKHCLGV